MSEQHKGRSTPEELVMIRDYIMLPYMLTMANKVYRDVVMSPHLFKRTYAGATKIVMDRITKELGDIKREFRVRNIKVKEEDSINDILQYRYWCRGYEDHFGIVRELMRAEIAKRFGKYEADIIRSLGK